MGLPENPDTALIAAEVAASTGVATDVPDATALVLELNPASQVTRLLKEYSEKQRGVTSLNNKARKAFEAVKTAAATKGFVDADTVVAQQMQENPYEDTCRDAARLLIHLDDRIDTTNSTLANMQADFDTCIEEIGEVVRRAILTLNKACSPEKCVPLGAPYVGGKQVLKMRASFSSVTTEMRRTILRTYLDKLAKSTFIPARGTELIADAVALLNRGPLGLQVLKMSVEESEQYTPVEKISNSGGEGVVMAMFLYLLINQLRAENFAQVQKSAGGPLILDNPFAKATSAAMWRAQRLLASAMNVQLIFATAVQDYNTLGEFQRFVRLRKVGHNEKTKRWHLEVANYNLTPSGIAEEAVA
jgi:hypothetical protein